MKNEKYIPALSYDWLTSLYDPVVALTTREKTFKRALTEQARIAVNYRVLDLACGTATLSILLKRKQPQAQVIGIDGDAKILEIAKKKARKAGLEIQLDEGMSFDLPYEDESFDRVISSLFFHHLTRENKSKTLREVKRVLKPNGEFHIADWGLPASWLMRGSSYLIQLLDGFETTGDNFNGLLPQLMADAGFASIEETNHFNSLFGTIRLHKCRNSANMENI
ncbi:MAG: class I SAM-dependent methyltransferase [Pyrinomonadaceae bacterium]